MKTAVILTTKLSLALLIDTRYKQIAILRFYDVIMSLAV